MAAAAGRLLSAHVTSCVFECNWALFGNISSKTKNCLAWSGPRSCLIRDNSDSGGTGADEEVPLSLAYKVRMCKRQRVEKEKMSERMSVMCR